MVVGNRHPFKSASCSLKLPKQLGQESRSNTFSAKPLLAAKPLELRTAPRVSSPSQARACL